MASGSLDGGKSGVHGFPQFLFADAHPRLLFPAPLQSLGLDLIKKNQAKRPTKQPAPIPQPPIKASQNR
jgi:hypothetical protein